MDSKAILSQFEGERRHFISAILSCAMKSRVWFTIDLDETARFTHCNRQRVVRALDYLGEHNMLEVQSSSVRLRYSRTDKVAQAAAIATQLHKRMLEREQFELQRLHEMLAFTAANTCLADNLSRHFGESLAKPCGHCRYCMGQNSHCLPEHATVSTPNIVFPADVTSLLDEHPNLFMDARTLTRFLCGLTSPQLGRAKLNKHPLFGHFAEQSFAQVLEIAAQKIQSIPVG
jgi:ATP-dependent DNA helicase RecQ